MKKSFKQMLSLLLCLCLLLGMPLAVSVSAADETPLTLTSWTVVDDTKVVMAFSESVNLPASGSDVSAYIMVHADDTGNAWELQPANYEWDSTNDVPTTADLWSSKTAKWQLTDLSYYDNNDTLLIGTINTGDANFTFEDIQEINAKLTGKWSHIVPKIAVCFQDSTRDDKIQNLTSKSGKVLTANLVSNDNAWAYLYMSDALKIVGVEAVNDTQIVFTFSEAVNEPAADASYTAGIAIRNYQNWSADIANTVFGSATWSTDETGQNTVTGTNPLNWSGDPVNWTILDLSYYNGDTTKLVGTLSGTYTYGDAKEALIALIERIQINWPHLSAELVAYISDTTVDTTVSAITSKALGTAKTLTAEQLSGKSWAEMKLTPGESAIAATPVNETSVLLQFEAPVIIYDATKITWGEIAATGVVEDTSSPRTSWTVTFASASESDLITFSSMAVRHHKSDISQNQYNIAQKAAHRTVTLPLTGWNNMTGTEQNALTDGTKYNMMNADTGRDITLDNVDEFTLVKADAANTYYIKNGDKYLNLLDSTPTETDTAISYWIEKNDNGRYRIMVDNAAIEDTNNGDTNAATLRLVAATDKWLSTGWYFTASGESRPVRMMAMGDSITFGTSGGGQYKHGWRDELSAQLDTYLDRNFVFVGPKVSKQAWIDTNELYRHAGYPGWFVDDIDLWRDADGLDMGIDTVIDGIVAKYAPDVTFLMLGTNDTSKIAWFTNHATSAVYTNAGQMDDEGGLFDRYEALIKKLAPALTENGSVIVSKLTPHGIPTGEHGTAISDFNDRMDAFVSSLQDQELSVYLNDNNTGFPEDGTVSDDVHMSDSGNAFICSRYLGTYKSIYGVDGNKKVVVATDIQAALDVAVSGDIVVAGKNATIELLKIPAGVTLDLNGKKITSTYVLSFGNVIDSSEGNGGIIVSNDPTKGLVSLQADNTALPLYDEDFSGYRFFSYELQNLGSKDKTDTSIKYGMRIVLPSNTAYDLLAVNNDVKVTMLLTVTANGKTSTMDYIFSTKTVNSFAVAMQEKDTYAITLTVSGIDAVTSISAAPTVTSPTGVYVVK